MTQCLFKALKAVDLDDHLALFRSLGYDSAGALAHFRAEHFQTLDFNEQELLRLITLLDVLKESTREGKICPHYFHSAKTNRQPVKSKAMPIKASWSDETSQPRHHCQSARPMQSNGSAKSKKSMSIRGRASFASITPDPTERHHHVLKGPSTVIGRLQKTTPTKNNNQHVSRVKLFESRPTVQHVKVSILTGRVRASPNFASG